MKPAQLLRPKLRLIRPWIVGAFFVLMMAFIAPLSAIAQQSQNAVLDGRLYVKRAVKHPAGAERLTSKLITLQGTYTLATTKGNFSGWPNLSAVQATGKLRGKTLTIDDPNVSLRPTQKTNLPTPRQSFTYAVVLIRFPDTKNVDPTFTAGNASKKLFTANNSSAAFFHQASNGRLTITGDVFDNQAKRYTVKFPPMKLYTNDQTEMRPFCDIDVLSQEVVDATKNDLTLSDYDGLMILVPDMSCAVTGLEGVTLLRTPQGSIRMPTTIVATDLSHATHEIGHNLGMDHATASYCNGQPGIFSWCEYSEYGDPYDIMGGGNFTPNAVHRELAGWLGRKQVLVADHTGDYSITPLEISDPVPKVLKIPAQVSQRGYVHAWYYLEFRQPIGFDAKTPDTLTLNNISNGVLVHYYAPNIVRWKDGEFATNLNLGKSILLDFSGETCGVSCKRPAAAMQIGQTYTDPKTRTTFYPIKKDDGSITIHVDYHGWPVCDPRISTYSFMSSASDRQQYCQQALIAASSLRSSRTTAGSSTKIK